MSHGNQPPPALQCILQAEHGHCSPGQVYQDHNKQLQCQQLLLYKPHLRGHMWPLVQDSGKGALSKASSLPNKDTETTGSGDTL